jgi:hypothetical protein
MTLSRTHLVRFKGVDLTPDTAAALTALQENAFATGGWQLEFGGDHQRDHFDGIVGRGVSLVLTHPTISVPANRCLEALWGFAVPLGFTPWDRWPLESDTEDLFIFMGPWEPLKDRLLAEGRGHLFWPSFRAACQVDAGLWQGDKSVVRFVQAQLHRIGLNPGPIDGDVGPRTVAAMETLGLKRPALETVAEYLRTAEPPQAPQQMTGKGHIVIPGRKLVFSAFGRVNAVRTNQGAALTIQGKGRIVVDVGEAE